MGFRQDRFTWLVLALLAGWVGEGAGWAQTPSSPPGEALSGLPPLALEQLPLEARNGVRRVLQQPTLFTHGPAEVFHGRPALYHWLLDHPDQAVRLWRRLGA